MVYPDLFKANTSTLYSIVHYTARLFLNVKVIPLCMVDAITYHAEFEIEEELLSWGDIFIAAVVQSSEI